MYYVEFRFGKNEGATRGQHKKKGLQNLKNSFFTVHNNRLEKFVWECNLHIVISKI